MLALVSLPFFLQNTLGRTEVATGLLLTPWPVATLFTAPLAGYLVERIHAGILGSIGMLIFATGLFLLTVLPAIPTDGAIIWRMIVCGIGFGLFRLPITVQSWPPPPSSAVEGQAG